MHKSKAIEPEVIDTDLIQLVTFAVGDITLGININNVQEINRNDEITEVPGAPEIFHGVINLRGDVVTVVDPHKIFDIERPIDGHSKRNLILNLNGERVGVLVDKVLDILEINKNDLTKRPSNVNTIDRRYIDSVYLSDTQIIVVVNAHALTQIAEAETDSAAA